MKPYLLVNGNFESTNGMDMPNLALASYLADQNREVHLVTHHAQAELARRPNVIVHHVPKPANSYLLATPALNWMGRRWASKINGRGGGVLVNGGNCIWGDVNWVHYVHAAFRQPRSRGMLRAVKNTIADETYLTRERAALKQARLVITNSERTRQDVIEHFDVEKKSVHTVYYGIDAEVFRRPTKDERIAARETLGWRSSTPVVAFVGALGDGRKGFDTLFASWQKLCELKQWDADLAVIGAGAQLGWWKSRTAQSGLQDRIRFLGFRKDVPRILAACDALVSPTRYEAYGQGVHEALCSGLPALVSQSAGVAERYPTALQDLLIPDPEDVDDLVDRLRNWRNRTASYERAVATVSRELRLQTWGAMSAQIVALAETA
jgi:glycosyltransferase involved in cell wall biosynthesis